MQIRQPYHDLTPRCQIKLKPWGCSMKTGENLANIFATPIKVKRPLLQESLIQIKALYILNFNFTFDGCCKDEMTRYSDVGKREGGRSH